MLDQSYNHPPITPPNTRSLTRQLLVLSDRHLAATIVSASQPPGSIRVHCLPRRRVSVDCVTLSTADMF
ncbi:hypothetical protein M3J09_004108 [Ascochyta lentis]